jgi:hypothetical protein
MANALQLRRGTTTQHSTFTGLAGEVTVDTTKDTVVVHDGSTAGGIPLATESYVGTQVATEVANLVDSAPSTLDTLNELAAALGDDPNFSTTVTNSIATKMPLSGGTFTGNVLLGDNVELQLGTSSDLKIFHNGGNSIIRDAGVGDFYLQGSSTVYITNPGGSETYAVFNENGSSSLWYDNNAKVTTTALGAVIGGGTAGEIQLNSTDYLIRGGTNYGDIRIDAPRFRVYESGNIALAVDGQDTLFYDTSGNADLRWDASASAMAFADNSKANFGNSADLQIYHNGSHSYIADNGTGNMYLSATGAIWFQNPSFTSTMATFTDGGAVDLRYNNTVRLSTTNTGANVVGSLTTDGLTSDGTVDVNGTLDIEEVVEKVQTSTSTSGTIVWYSNSQGIVYYTSNQTANRTINFVGDGSTSMNSFLDVGQSYTASVVMTQGSTAYYLNAYQVDGSAVTPKWSGGSAPTAGNASGIDVYTFTIIKTANATFTVLASLTQYA